MLACLDDNYFVAALEHPMALSQQEIECYEREGLVIPDFRPTKPIVMA